MNIGGVGVPWEAFFFWNGQLVPHWVAFRDSLIGALEHVRQHTRLDNLLGTILVTIIATK